MKLIFLISVIFWFRLLVENYNNRKYACLSKLKY